MFTLKNESRAKAYLMKERGNLGLEAFIESILDLVPRSTKYKYGLSDTLIAANYHKMVLKKDLFDIGFIRQGGGLYTILKDCSLGSRFTRFTYLPFAIRGVEDTDDEEMQKAAEMNDYSGLIITLGSGEIKQTDEDEIYDLILEGVVSPVNFAGTSLDKLKRANQGNTLTRKEKRDFKEAAVYLRKLFKSNGIESPEDFSNALKELKTNLTEEELKDFPDTKEGMVIAVTAYVLDNEVEAERVLKAYSEMKRNLETEIPSGTDSLKTGSVFFVTENKYGLIKDGIYTLYHDRVNDRFYIIHLATTFGQLAKSIFGISMGGLAVASAVVIAGVALPPLGAAIVAGTTATSAIAPAAFAFSTAATTVGVAANSMVATGVAAAGIAATTGLTHVALHAHEKEVKSNMEETYSETVKDLDIKVHNKSTLLGDKTLAGQIGRAHV